MMETNENFNEKNHRKKLLLFLENSLDISSLVSNVIANEYSYTVKMVSLQKSGKNTLLKLDHISYSCYIVQFFYFISSW